MRRRLAAENGPSRGRGTSILVASIMRVAKSPLTKIVTICQHLGRSRQSKAAITGGGMRQCNLQRTCAAARRRLKSRLGSAVEAGHWWVRWCPLTVSQTATSAAAVTFLEASHSYLDTKAKDWSAAVRTAKSAPPARRKLAATTCTSPPVSVPSNPARPRL